MLDIVQYQMKLSLAIIASMDALFQMYVDIF